MISEDGRLKVLDFGLGKMDEPSKVMEILRNWKRLFIRAKVSLLEPRLI